MVDCARKYGNFGCSGGYLTYYAAYVRDYGAVAYSGYGPYTATDGTCVEVSEPRTKISSYGYIGRTVAEIANQLDNGPMEVTLAAGNSAFRSYSGGILSASDGCPLTYDHAVTLVGYGTKVDT